MEHRPDALTEFTKTKMHFALALLGTLFALHPFLEKQQFADLGFDYLGVKLKVFYVYALVAGLLAFTVYCYAVALLRERADSLLERLGNYAYAVAVLVVPIYGGLYGSTWLAERFQQEYLVLAGPTVPVALGIGWLVLSQLLAWRLRLRLSATDRQARVEQLADQEIHCLGRARDMFATSHYDLSVIEAWKAIEARLRRALLLRKIYTRHDTPQALIRAATRAGLLSKPSLTLLDNLRTQWNVAVSVEPLTREAADTALTAARNILATIPLETRAAKPNLAV